MSVSPLSPQPDDANIHETQPPPSLALPTSKPSSRRLPPPCWSHDEAIALIDAYRDKWYSLRRGNLKAFHWQEVADAVAARCPLASPAKTAVQCRHKMEKLRKRYRTEIQRSKSIPVSRFISSWVLFKRMDAMEKGPALAKPVDDDSGSNDDEDDTDEDDADLETNMYPDAGRFGRREGNGNKAGFGLVGNGVGGRGYGGGNGAGAGGFRIKIPNGVSIAKPGTNFRTKGYVKYDDDNDVPSASVHLGYSATRDEYGKELDGMRAGGGKGSGLGKREREGGDSISEMVSAINLLADGFVKTEQKKMEMAREIEVMRMDMESKRLKMILESQERVIEAFTKAAASEQKKRKKVASPE